MSLITSPSGLKERQLTQAYFVIAIKHMEKDEIDKYEFSIAKVKTLDSLSYVEFMYHLMLVERNKISG